jgi:catechol 2,3-dioxygenase-like lactoylglutathione lyase family enzyme
MTTESHRLFQVTPFLHVPDLAAALDMLVNVLQFEVRYREENYAYLVWGPAALRVLEEPGRARAVPGRDARMTVYIDVQGVDALFEELRPRLEALPSEDWVAPGDKSYGQRELHVRLPDGHWVAFGEPVK